jgi:hypothetical protein
MKIAECDGMTFAIEQFADSCTLSFQITEVVDDKCFILPRDALVTNVLFENQAKGSEPVLAESLMLCAGQNWIKFQELTRTDRYFIATQYLMAYVNNIKLAFDDIKSDSFGDFKVWKTKVKNPTTIIFLLKESDHNKETIDFLLRNRRYIEEDPNQLAIEMSRNVNNMMKEMQYE